MAKTRELKAGEIEITWANRGSAPSEYIQTYGIAYNAGALVLDVGGSKLIIPFTSVKSFRVKSA